ncbi:GmrSD restriction endonuclease domain-containing protein [Guptibacillus hwajinpoensis]|uniref:GmrSD restriction endonuclease domain-containing protein n=1 Tax=Guptibacillus hwajinpoensis TaxID=208199 RepID=UPI001CFCDC9A|nr:DUF262 domain-containing protein [Pseudalkalibacillus hwajinpoensis]
MSSTFKLDEPSLPQVLEDIHKGKVQLPDFQRGWVWDDEHIRSLIASVSVSYPIGAVMILQTGGGEVQFQPRPIQSVNIPSEVKPEHLILDGQQRMTSLYLSLFSREAVPTKTTKGKNINRVYYLKISDVINPNIDRGDAVVSIPSERKITSNFGRDIELDLSTNELEYKQGYFPLEIIFDNKRYNHWRREYQRLFRSNDDKLDEFDKFEAEVIERFKSYRVPVIELLKETPKEAVCHVFEKVNTGGVTLTVFELVTAIFAVDNFNLRKDWEERQSRLKEHAVLKDVDSTTFLTAVTLLKSYYQNKKSNKAISCKRKDVLDLTLEEYEKHAQEIEVSLIQVKRFLAREKVFDVRTLPYSTQLIPLAATFAVLKNDWEVEPVRRKISQWYWSGVFGELYGGANESRFAFDMPEVLKWVENDNELPRTISEANFSPIRLLSMQSRLSAAYKGLMALLMKSGSKDFMNDDPIEITNYFDLAIDIHHIFPRSYSQKQNFKRNLWNSSVNKAPLSARTNRSIGGRAPSSYLESIEKNSGISPDRLDKTLITHCIDPELLRKDQFHEFIRERAGHLLDLIEAAMGKKISGRDSDEVIDSYGGPLR